MSDSLLNILISAKDLASSVIKGLNGVVANLDTTTQKLYKQGLKAMNDGFSEVVDWAKKATVAVGIAAVAITGIGFSTASSFQAQISSIKALTGATQSQVTVIQDLALKLGKETKFSALESAQGIEELLKAGVSLEQAINGGIKGALDLAAAGEISVAYAAEIASTALNAFKADGLSVSKAADILAGAANASATNIMELKLGLSQVASVASGVGMSFKDTSTALAIFAQNGLKGSDAGTSLKTMLLNLQPSSEKQIALFDQLGFTTEGLNNQFFDSQGHVRSLAEISGVLKDKLAGLTDQQRMQALEVLFGSDAIRASNILYKEGAEGITAMSEAMSQFTASDVAAERMNNFNGALDNLKSTIETLFIQIFLPLLPQITEGIKGFTDTLNTVDATAVTETLKQFLGVIFAIFGWLVANTQLIGGLLAVLAGGFGGLSVALAYFNTMAAGAALGASGLVPSLLAVGAAGWVAIAPFIPFIAIGAAIAGMLYLLKTAFDQNWFGIKDSTFAFISWMTDGFTKFWNWLSSGTINNLVLLLQANANANTIWQTMTAELWFMLADIFRGNMTAIAQRLAKWALFLHDIFKDAWEKIKNTVWDALVGIANGVGQKFTDMVNYVGKAINEVIKKINEVLQSDAAKAIIGAFGGKTEISKIEEVIFKAVDSGTGGAATKALNWNEEIANMFEGMGNEALKKGKDFQAQTDSLIKTIKGEQTKVLELAKPTQAASETQKVEIQNLDLSKEVAKSADLIKQSQAITNQPASIIPQKQSSSGGTKPTETQAEKDLKVLKAQLDILKDQANVDIEALQRQKESLQYEEAKARLTEASIIMDTTKSDALEQQLKALEAQKLTLSQLDPLDKAGKQQKDDQLEAMQRMLIAKRDEIELAKQSEQQTYKEAQNARDKAQKERDLQQLEIDRQIQQRKDKLADESRSIEQKIGSITIQIIQQPGESADDLADKVSVIFANKFNAA